MIMVGHEAVSHQLYRIIYQELLDAQREEPIVSVIGKNGPAITAPVKDMVAVINKMLHFFDFCFL